MPDNKMNGVYQDPLVTQMMTQMNRIEGKVDAMQTAFVQMARTEERVVRLLEADQKKTEWLFQLQNRLVEVEKSDIGSKAISTRIERAAWIFVTALLTAGIGWLVTHGGI
jgi:hypothetical protein